MMGTITAKHEQLYVLWRCRSCGLDGGFFAPPDVTMKTVREQIGAWHGERSIRCHARRGTRLSLSIEMGPGWKIREAFGGELACGPDQVESIGSDDDPVMGRAVP